MPSSLKVLGEFLLRDKMVKSNRNEAESCVKVAAHQQLRSILPKLFILVFVYIKTNTVGLETCFVGKT